MLRIFCIFPKIIYIKYLLASQCALIWSTSGLLCWFPKKPVLYFSLYACILLFLLSTDSFHSLRFPSGITAFGSLLVTITGASAPCLKINVPIPAFDCFTAFSGWLLLLRVFPFCNGRDHLLIFPTVIKRTFFLSKQHQFGFPGDSPTLSEDFGCCQNCFYLI